MRKKVCLFLLPAAVLFLLGCESTPEKSQPNDQAKTPQFETGRFALQKMIPAARLWAADGQPVRLASTSGKDNLGHDGKSAYWQATFGSVSRQRGENFSWSGLVGANAPPRGVDHGPEESFNPSNRSTQPFDVIYLKIDSNQAFDVAQQHGGKQLLEKNPNQEIIYILDWDSRVSEVRWHVIYGSENRSQLTVIVNASTGDFEHKE